MFVNLLKSKITYLIILTYAFFVGFWLFLLLTDRKEGSLNNAYGLAYSFVALFGGVLGFVVARRWGGFRSQVGRGITFFSLGLLSLAFGQMVFSYYNFISDVEIPFPSIADIGYTAIILFYFLGASSLLRASGGKFGLKTWTGKLAAPIIPLVMLSASYFVLLDHIDTSELSSLGAILSIGTPLGQAIYISVAILAFLLSRKLLGGVMRKRILFLIGALTMEYIAEFTFFYQVNKETYYNGGIDDLFFATAIITMILGIYSLHLKSPAKEQIEAENE